jgi:hypothetical protein
MVTNLSRRSNRIHRKYWPWVYLGGDRWNIIFHVIGAKSAATKRKPPVQKGKTPDHNGNALCGTIAPTCVLARQETREIDGVLFEIDSFFEQKIKSISLWSEDK